MFSDCNALGKISTYRSAMLLTWSWIIGLQNVRTHEGVLLCVISRPVFGNETLRYLGNQFISENYATFNYPVEQSLVFTAEICWKFCAREIFQWAFYWKEISENLWALRMRFSYSSGNGKYAVVVALRPYYNTWWSATQVEIQILSRPFHWDDLVSLKSFRCSCKKKNSCSWILKLCRWSSNPAKPELFWTCTLPRDFFKRLSYEGKKVEKLRR